MKTINVRQLRNGIPQLRETLTTEHELLLVSKGEPIARILPVETQVPRVKLPSLKAFRDAQPRPKTSIEALLREERDRR